MTKHLDGVNDSKIKPGLDRKFERDLFKSNTAVGGVVIGVDEAGRGPLAGPVVAAAYALPFSGSVDGVQDSKKLCEADRDDLFDKLRCLPGCAFSVEERDAKYIDEHNILSATLDAMTAASLDVIQKLTATGVISDTTPVRICIDGNRLPPGLVPPPSANVRVDTYVKGDGRVFSIGAASILAKVTRDRIMCAFHELHPSYNLAQHKGYPTAAHQATVKQIGPSTIHRLSFQPIKGWLESGHVKLPEGRSLPPPPPPKLPARKRMSVPASKSSAKKLIAKGQLSLLQFSRGAAKGHASIRADSSVVCKRIEVNGDACKEELEEATDEDATFAMGRRRKCVRDRNDQERTNKRLRRAQ